MTWLKANITLVGIIVVAIVLLIAIGSIKGCMDRGKEAAQAKQTATTGAAFANAVANGIETIDNRIATESTVAEATATVKEEIGSAQSLDAIDAAITASLCKDTRHRNDPACRVP